MPEVVGYAMPAGPVALEKDRSGGLVAFGIISLVFGGLAALLGIVSTVGIVIAMMMTPGPVGSGNETGHLMAAVVVMLGMCGICCGTMVWLGIGSIRKRRWVRPLVLSLAALWLASGVIGSVMFLCSAIILPQPAPKAAPPVIGINPPAPTAGAAGPAPVTVATTAAPPLWLTALSLAGMVIISIAVPLSYLLFYKSRHVRMTLEAYDLTFRWTDRCPLPVLAISIWSIGLAAMTLLGMLGGYSDFFGIFVTGWRSVGVALLKAAMLAAAAVLSYRRSMIGWWLAAAYVAIWGTSLVLSQLYASEESIRQTMGGWGNDGQLRDPVRRLSAILYALALAAALAYLLCVRPWFRRASQPEDLHAVAGAR